MKSVKLHPHWQTDTGLGKVLRILLLVALLFFLWIVRLGGQSVSPPAVEGQTPIFTQEAGDAWLETPAETSEFIVLGVERVVRIVTLHRNLPEGTAPGTISLFYDNGGYDLGTWEAIAEPHPDDPTLTYWVVTLDLELYPGCYHVVDSDPGTWANSEGLGVVWVFGRTGGASM